jgi:hypothetical protein
MATSRFHVTREFTKIASDNEEFLIQNPLTQIVHITKVAAGETPAADAAFYTLAHNEAMARALIGPGDVYVKATAPTTLIFDAWTEA